VIEIEDRHARYAPDGKPIQGQRLAIQASPSIRLRV